MELLDKKVRMDSCEYKVIGGKSCSLVRRPSAFMDNAPSANSFSGSPGWWTKAAKRKLGSLDSADGGSASCSPEGKAILKWDLEDIKAWLSEIGMERYQVGIITLWCTAEGLPHPVDRS